MDQYTVASKEEEHVFNFRVYYRFLIVWNIIILVAVQ